MQTVEAGAKAKWNLDPGHTELGFKVKHLMVSYLRGSFKEYTATIYTQGEDFTSARMEVRINATSINTGDEMRDQNLKGENFFDVGKFQYVVYTGTKLERIDDENLILYGSLTIKGTTKPLQFNVQFGGLTIDPWGKRRAGFVLTGRLDRRDYGLTWNTLLESGGVMVGNEVIINCDVELIKEA
jgi:polyisoprenoid-binding protein YceI